MPLEWVLGESIRTIDFSRRSEYGFATAVEDLWLYYTSVAEGLAFVGLRFSYLLATRL